MFRLGLAKDSWACDFLHRVCLISIKVRFLESDYSMDHENIRV